MRLLRQKSDLGSFQEMVDSKALDIKFISFPCLKGNSRNETNQSEGIFKRKGCVYFIYLFILQKYLTAKTKQKKTS